MIKRIDENEVDGRLLEMVANQIKLPWVQVARQAELAKLTGDFRDSLVTIEQTADYALRLIDSYLLSTKMAMQKGQLEFEAVSISAVLNDVAHQLYLFAKDLNCQLEIHLPGRYQPVIVHKLGLETALTNLGYVFIEASSQQLVNESKPIIKLAAHHSKNGLIAGVFTDNESITSDIYKRALNLYGKASQTFPELVSSSGAGVFVANSIFKSMSSSLRISHHQKLSGLGANLMPSHQLSLI